jgi:hypothetical protein
MELEMKTTTEEIRSWIRKEQRKKKPSQIYIKWLQRQVSVNVSAHVVKSKEKSSEQN